MLTDHICLHDLSFDVPVFKTIWTIEDSHWVCVLHMQMNSFTDIKVLENYQVPLKQFLWSNGFDIPETITYCVAKNSIAELYYRVFSNKIICYLIPFNDRHYD